MIKGIFIIFSGNFLCSNQVEIKIVPEKKGIAHHTLFTAYNCYGTFPDLFQDVDCLIRYEVGPPMRFTAHIREFTTEGTAVLRMLSELSKDNVTQLFSTIAKLK